MPPQKLLNIARGIALLAELPGQGVPAGRGDRIVFNMKIWLHRGDEVPLNAIQSQHLPENRIRNIGGEWLVDHHATLGQREVMAGVEKSLTGMRPGGYRKVQVSPHLAYREKGLPGLIPERAVLVVEIWLREILPAVLPVVLPADR
jgi:FKBP-type peptidyl-prolyl cis-trans isomerase (trigger factor)